MAIEMLRAVSEAEQKSDAIRREANQKALAAREKAAQDAIEFKADKKRKAMLKAEQIMNDAKIAAEAETKSYLENIEGECAAIKSGAEGNIEKAVGIIIAKVVNMNG